MVGWEGYTKGGGELFNVAKPITNSRKEEYN